MVNDYYRIAVSVRLTHPAPLGKVPVKQEPRRAVFVCILLRASAARGFHVKLHAQNLRFTGVFFMLDSVVLQELRDQYNDLTGRVGELRRFL
jgi:hypothetical protein